MKKLEILTKLPKVKLPSSCRVMLRLFSDSLLSLLLPTLQIRWIRSSRTPRLLIIPTISSIYSDKEDCLCVHYSAGLITRALYLIGC